MGDAPNESPDVSMDTSRFPGCMFERDEASMFVAPRSAFSAGEPPSEEVEITDPTVCTEHRMSTTTENLGSTWFAGHLSESHDVLPSRHSKGNMTRIPAGILPTSLWPGPGESSTVIATTSSAIVPQPFDILYGRGKKNKNHPGNLRMLQIVSFYRREYAMAKRRVEKKVIADNIVTLLKSGRRRARFLRFDIRCGRWYEVPDAEAKKKIGHAIRDGFGDVLEMDWDTLEEVSLHESRKDSSQQTESEAESSEKSEDEAFRELEDDAQFLMQVYDDDSLESVSGEE